MTQYIEHNLNGKRSIFAWCNISFITFQKTFNKFKDYNLYFRVFIILFCVTLKDIALQRPSL